MEDPKNLDKIKKAAPPTQNPTLPNIQVSGGFVSPLLPPKLIEDYNRLIPTFGEDLHAEVKVESKHRRSNENWIIKGRVIGSFVAQISALLISAWILYIVYSLAMADKTTVAAILGGLDIVALAAVFLGKSYIDAKNAEVDDLD